MNTIETFTDPYAEAPPLAEETVAVAALALDHAARRRARAYIPATQVYQLALREGALLDRTALTDPDDTAAAQGALAAAIDYRELVIAPGSPIALLRADYELYRQSQRLPISASTLSRQLAANFRRSVGLPGRAGRAPRVPGFACRSRHRAVDVDYLTNDAEERERQLTAITTALRGLGYTVTRIPVLATTILRVTRYPATETRTPMTATTTETTEATAPDTGTAAQPDPAAVQAGLSQHQLLLEETPPAPADPQAEQEHQEEPAVVDSEPPSLDYDLDL